MCKNRLIYTSDDRVEEPIDPAAHRLLIHSADKLGQCTAVAAPLNAAYGLQAFAYALARHRPRACAGSVLGL